MTKLDNILNDYRNNTTYLFMRYYTGDLDIESVTQEIEKQNTIFKRKLSNIIKGAINDTNTNKK